MGGDEKWEVTSFDDDFIERALITEPSAAERHREQERSVRQQRLRDALAEEERTSRLLERNAERSQWRRRVGVAVGLVAVVGTGFALSRTSGGSPVSDAAMFRLWQDESPTRSLEARRTPVGRPPPITVRSDQYRFLATQRSSKSPVAYDPCRTLHYVINERTAPANGPALVTEAIDKISAASGLQFVNDGLTDEGPSATRAAYQPKRYGPRWAPILISWTDPNEVPGLKEQTVGLGGSTAIIATDHTLQRGSVYVTGQVELDGPEFLTMLNRPPNSGEMTGAEIAAVAIVHELGHVLGLDHIDDPAQIMYPESGRAQDLGEGDRNGLALLGSGRCFPQI